MKFLPSFGRGATRWKAAVSVLKPHVFFCLFFFIFSLSFRIVLFFVNSQARLKARARGRIRLTAKIAQAPCTLDHGVPGKEAGILWGCHITLLFSDSLDWQTGQLWRCLKATRPKDFFLQPSLMRRLHADQLYSLVAVSVSVCMFPFFYNISSLSTPVSKIMTQETPRLFLSPRLCTFLQIYIFLFGIS